MIMRDPDRSLFTFLAETPHDLVWPVLHGASGEDGALRALLATRAQPFVGALAAPSVVAWHKPSAKTVVSHAGVATPASMTFPRDSFRELGPDQVFSLLCEGMPGPWVIKPAEGGSAQGVTIVTEPKDLPRAVVQAYTYGDSVLIERHIVGTEVAVSIVDRGNGPELLPPVEIAPVSGNYTYHARYNAGETRFFAPARLDPDVLERVGADGLRVHSALGLRHLSRVDFIVDADGVPWFLDANVMPGLTETSILPQAILASGSTLGEVYESIGENALREVS